MAEDSGELHQPLDRTEGIAHMPLPESERTDPKTFLRNFGGYVATAFGRMYQARIREVGGKPNTSNAVLEAAVSNDPNKLTEAFLAGGETRARLQLANWEQAGVQIPESMREGVENVLTVAFVGLNVAESVVLMTAGPEPYKQLLELEGKGGVADWAGGGDNHGGDNHGGDNRGGDYQGQFKDVKYGSRADLNNDETWGSRKSRNSN